VKGLSGMEVVGRGRDLEEGRKEVNKARRNMDFPSRSGTPRHYMNLEEKENIYLV